MMTPASTGAGISTLLHHEAGSMPCLSVVGEIDGRTLELFAAAVCELIEAATGDQARLDLTTVTGFSTAGLAALCTLGEVAAEHDVVLVIHTSAVIRRVLGSAGLTSE